MMSNSTTNTTRTLLVAFCDKKFDGTRVTHHVHGNEYKCMIKIVR